MEIGDETVQHAEGKAGIIKISVSPLQALISPIPRRSCLQRAGLWCLTAITRCPAAALCGRWPALCLFADGIPFTVHFMGKDIVVLNWAKGAEANMQRHWQTVMPIACRRFCISPA